MRGISSGSRVVFVQNGDFRAEAQRIESGAGETYHSQKYSMQVMDRLATQTSLAAVLCIDAVDPHDEILPTGVRCIGLENIWSHKRPFAPVIAVLEKLAPTHLVLRVPSVEVLSWARARHVRTLPSFADSF